LGGRIRLCRGGDCTALQLRENRLIVDNRQSRRRLLEEHGAICGLHLYVSRRCTRVWRRGDQLSGRRIYRCARWRRDVPRRDGLGGNRSGTSRGLRRYQTSWSERRRRRHLVPASSGIARDDVPLIVDSHDSPIWKRHVARRCRGSYSRRRSCGCSCRRSSCRQRTRGG
jgi:hypothetical protein